MHLISGKQSVEEKYINVCLLTMEIYMEVLNKNSKNTESL